MKTLNEQPVACDLDALTSADRAREQVLLAEHRANIQATVEREDGFGYRYPSDPALFVRMAEFVGLEHRCCPFLDFELRWDGAGAAPWLFIQGGEGAKSFIANTFHP